MVKFYSGAYGIWLNWFQRRITPDPGLVDGYCPRQSCSGGQGLLSGGQFGSELAHYVVLGKSENIIWLHLGMVMTNQVTVLAKLF